ncbi:MAG: Uma2 family endonuclease [Chroococcidiopsidaceae cyanobacterium CP_BM_ER_R8_30]|nr:Uma2 family endonuclease [Chroococcidiopsidaceae cyanobacterium CP_BM_ER_R8_30]
MTALTLNLDAIVQLTDDAFFALCRANPEVKLERTAKGELIVMPPTGGETGNRNIKPSARLESWTEEDGSGLAFDSSTMFQLPNGAYRSPDAAWILLERWEVLSPKEREGFPPICPDFVVELRSPSDSLKTLQDKMHEYIDNDVRLGWLLNPQDRQVEIYRQGLVQIVTEEYTSKTCTKCGHVHQELGGAKKFSCPKCGYKLPRDWNGAFGIFLKALQDTASVTFNGNGAIVKLPGLVRCNVA